MFLVATSITYTRRYSLLKVALSMQNAELSSPGENDPTLEADFSSGKTSKRE